MKLFKSILNYLKSVRVRFCLHLRAPVNFYTFLVHLNRSTKHTTKLSDMYISKNIVTPI